MAAADVQQPPAEPAAAPAPGIPDYLASPNAVLGDKDAQWRYGRAPDYSKTRKVWEESEYDSITSPFCTKRHVLPMDVKSSSTQCFHWISRVRRQVYTNSTRLLCDGTRPRAAQPCPRSPVMLPGLLPRSIVVLAQFIGKRLM